ncbi:MAG: hypothetical protein J6Y94_03220 [Bacteriovoracaceae bacterium]|nr:hypothetical protein [Bacteriovoracaceae bacterium]
MNFFKALFFRLSWLGPTLSGVILIVLAAVLAPAATAASKRDCLITQAAFDIGSGATKMVVAQVDRCQHKVVRFLQEEQAGVNYYQDLKQNQQKFSAQIQAEGLAVLNKLKAQAQEKGAQEFIAVGAQAFRDALNAQEIQQKIEAAGIKFKVVTQDEEAKIGFQAAAAVSGIAPQDLAIWDIGGGSMQIAFLQDASHPQGPLTTYNGNIAAKGFLHLILKTFYPAQTTTPNPYGKKITAAQKLAAALAEILIPPSFKEALAQKQVVGIGPVHNIAVLKVLAPSKDYSLVQLEKSIKAKQNYTDAQLGNDQFSPETLTNALLVAGFMEALKIKQLIPVKVHLGHGILGQTF